MSTVVDISLLPEVEAFLKQGTIPAFVGGKDVRAHSGATLETLDPGSGRKLADLCDLSAAEVDQAVDTARDAFPAWSKLTVEERSKILLRLADAVEQRKEIIAQIEALDAGKIEAQAQGDVQNFVDTLRYFVKLSGQVQLRNKLDVPAMTHGLTNNPGAHALSYFRGTFRFS